MRTYIGQIFCKLEGCKRNENCYCQKAQIKIDIMVFDGKEYPVCQDLKVS